MSGSLNQFIPVQPVPSQQFTVTLNTQSVGINLYQRSTGLYIDVLVNDQLIIGGVLCEDRNYIVRDKYLGFQGDFSIVDISGTQDPDYTGLGGRYRLVYWAPEAFLT